MKMLTFLILVLSIVPAFAQKQSSADKALDKASELYETGKTFEAIEAFEKVMKNFPNYAATARAHYNIGYIYFELGDYKKAADVFKEILTREYNETDPNSLMEPYALYKHRSARHLAEISLLVKQWADAERYIQMFDKEFPYQHFCGNEWAAYHISKATMDARLHEGQGRIDEAVKDLIPHIFNNGLAGNGRAISLLKDILRRNYSDKEILTELNASLGKIRIVNDPELKAITTLFGVELSIGDYGQEPTNEQEAVKSLRSNPVYVVFLGEQG